MSRVLPLMGMFFHGWRRKTGLVTLVMACVCMGGWLRSFSFMDQLRIPDHRRQQIHVFHSLNGALRWIRIEQGAEPDDVLFTPNWMVVSRKTKPQAFASDNRFIPETNCRFHWAGFGAADLSSNAPAGSFPTIVWFPYWSIIMPLTMISAWLLLISKPTHRKPLIKPV